jgi:hypothetical protein
VNPLRISIFNYRKLALLLLALTLCVKALVPAGFMVERKAMVLTVTICTDGLGAAVTQQMVIPMKPDPASHKGEPSKDDGICGFTAIGFGALAAVDPAHLATALLFILALGFVAQSKRRWVASRRLLPPANGPPRFG